MNQHGIDWAYVRQHTLIPALSALLVLVFVTLCFGYRDHQRLVYAKITSNQDALHDDYDDLVYERRLVSLYHMRYRMLHEHGFVGQESRLDWIEALGDTTRQLTLPLVSYAIEPQLKVITPVSSILGDQDIQLNVSRLQLQMGILHELDLLRFIDQLQRDAPGLIDVDSCELQWLPGASPKRVADANIQAICSLEIFSVITSDIDTTGTQT